MVFSLNGNLFSYLLGIFFLWLLLITVLLIKTLRHYSHLVGKNKKQDLKKVLEAILLKLDKHEENLLSVDKRLEQDETKSLKYLQRVGFLRFNPFSDTGGDQSFILSLLSAEDNGIILSSLHSRGTTRLYAKAIKNGQGDKVPLSKEEKEVINKLKSRRG